jgi:drug/metabolite transporter (DMT)-like permease
MLSVVLALGASVGYGMTDFLAGLAARKIPVPLLGSTTQPIGLLLLLVLLPFSGGTLSTQAVVWGALSGIAGVAAYATLFSALAIGPMSVASPVSAVVAVVLPVTAGVLFGDRLPAIAWLGIVVGIVAVVMVSQVHEDAPHPVSGRVLWLSIAAGVFISGFLIALERSPDGSGLWPLVTVRVVTSVAFVGFAVATSSLQRPPRDAFLLGATSTCLDVVATLMFLLATRHGLLSVVAVITGLYPAATVLMANAVLHEHLQRLQRVGLVLAAVSVSVLALTG